MTSRAPRFKAALAKAVAVRTPKDGIIYDPSAYGACDVWIRSAHEMRRVVAWHGRKSQAFTACQGVAKLGSRSSGAGERKNMNLMKIDGIVTEACRYRTFAHLQISARMSRQLRVPRQYLVA